MIHTKRFSSELIPVAILAMLVLFFFRTIILSGSTLFGSDFILQFYPWKKFIYDHVRANGTLPFWNPYLFSGTPFIANIQASMFYPLGWLYYLIPPQSAYGFSTMLHCALGSIFMFIFMRTLSVSRCGAFLSAFIFSFNGYFMAHLYAGHLSFVQNYIWIPLVFCLARKFFRSIRFKWAISAGLILGVQILGGFPQIAFYTILAVLALGLFYMAVSLKARQLKDVIALGAGLVTMTAVGFALTAVQLLPTLEFTHLSTRAGGVSYDFATIDSLHPKELFSFLIPEIFGNVIDQTYWRSRESWHFWETCGYVGIFPLCLCFVRTKTGSLQPLRCFFVTFTLLSLFLALGKYNPLYSIIYKMPGFNSFRIPAQVLFLYVFGLAVLAGIGLHRMLTEEWLFGKPFLAFLSIIGIILLCSVISLHAFSYHFFFHLFQTFAQPPIPKINMAAFHHKVSFAVDRAALLFFLSALLLLVFKKDLLSSRWFKILASVLVIGDLGLFSMQFVRPYQLVSPTYKKRLVAQLNDNPIQGRVVTLGTSFKPNDGLKYRFPSILGYDPLILRRYARYIQASQNLPPSDRVVNLAWIRNPDARLLRLLNVRKVIQERRISKVDQTLPYATIVDKAIIKRESEVLPFMKSADFDPKKMVVLESEEHEWPDTYDNAEVDFKGSCSVLHYDHQNIRIKTSTNRPGYLVLSEVFYPGWKSTVDGKKVSMSRGNYLFRVIPVNKGTHEVVLRFVSWPFRVGAIISLFTLAGSLWLILRKRAS